MIRIVYGYILVMFALTVCGCTGSSSFPEGSLSIKVVDENGKPLSGAEVGLGFEQGYKNGKPRMFPIIGNSGSNGIFIAKARTSNYISYGAIKNGYYRSSLVHRFKSKSNNRWEPWNPELTVVLRKIENPMPMYARKAELILPVLNKDVGFDLVEYDWIAPYGKGKHGDIVFNSNRRWENNRDFDGTLTIKFNGSENGILLVNENREYGSQFKLPRYAPEDGYAKQIHKKIHAKPGEGINYDYHEDSNYIFRIRSSNGSNNKLNSMYGKIHGDFSYGFKGKTAIIVFTYYLNPDHTRNLEFDPKRNLFTDLKSFERVGL